MDLTAAIGYVVAHGDEVERARLAYLRSGTEPSADLVELVEAGQLPDAGWPAQPGGEVASVDATCFRFAELVDLAALGRPAARQALDWLAVTQRPDGTWEEDKALADQAPPWAVPGDPEARLYLTATAAFWLSVAGRAARSGGPRDERVGGAYAGMVTGAIDALQAQLRPDGGLPSFLATNWLAAAVMYAQRRFEPAVRMRMVLERRLPDLVPADLASLTWALRWSGVDPADRLLNSAERRLGELQRPDGGWLTEDDDDPFAVHTALTVIRACTA